MSAKTTSSFGFLLLLCLITLNACYYDNAEELYPVVNSDCNSDNATLTTSVKPIFQASCYTCHSASNANSLGAGIDIETYSRLKTYVDNGQLMGSINHDSGYSPMPKGGGKLTDCQILTIQNWINAGAQND